MVIDGVASETRYGPQPHEGILSVVCEAFGCTPDVAKRQDWPTVKAILDYRTASWAVDAFNDRQSGMATMGRNPHLVEMLKAMLQAQMGIDEAGAGAALEAMRSSDSVD